MVVHFDEKTFDEAVRGEKPVLVDFWATWCGPCRMIAPAVEEVAADFEGRAVVGKVDVDEQTELARRFGPGADLPDLGLQALQVLEGLRLLARVPQQGRRVIQGCHPHAVFLKKLAVLLGDPEIRLDDLRRADAAQAHQDLRLHQLQLPPQKSGAGVLFGVQRVPVFGRAALDAVGDVDFLPPQADHGQHIVQQLPGGSHKGLTLLVLAGPGGLAHQQHLRRGGPHPEHHVGPGIRQAAGPAAHALLPQLLPLVHIFPPFPRLCPGIAAALPGQNEGEGRRRRVLAVAVLSV